MNLRDYVQVARFLLRTFMNEVAFFIPTEYGAVERLIRAAKIGPTLLDGVVKTGPRRKEGKGALRR